MCGRGQGVPTAAASEALRNLHSRVLIFRRWNILFSIINLSLTGVGMIQIPQVIGEDAFVAFQNFLDQVINIL